MDTPKYGVYTKLRFVDEGIIGKILEKEENNENKKLCRFLD